MINLPLITDPFRNRFSFFGPLKGNQALATLRNLQDVVNQLNNQMLYQPVHFKLSAPGGKNPIVYSSLQEGGSGAECTEVCTCNGTTTCACVTSLSCGNPKAGATLITNVTYFAVGVYKILLNANHPRVMTNQGIGVWASALKNKDHAITISDPVKNVITIETFNAGVAADGVLNNAIFQMNVYSTK